MNLSDKEYDDLTVIKGIGPGRQRWLRESFGVCTFQDLAALQADEIETRLKAVGQTVNRRAIEEWILEARRLAVALPSERVVEPAETEDSGKTLVSAGENEWESFASFLVEFQTRRFVGSMEEQRTKVHHIETNKGETWPGLQSEQLCQWLLSQLDEKTRHRPVEESTAEVPSAATSPLTVKITHIRVFQPPKTEKPIGLGRAGEPFPGVVRGDQPFALEAGFELDRLAIAEAARSRTTYSAQFHVRNWSTGAKTHLGDTDRGTLFASKVSYGTILPETSLQPGKYRLGVLVTIQGRSPSLGYLELPLLQVA